MTNQIASSSDVFNTKNWLTTGQAATLLKLAPGTLQNWRTQGKGPKYIKRGNHVYYPKVLIEDYLDNNAKLYQSTYHWKTQKD